MNMTVSELAALLLLCCCKYTKV